MHVRGGGVAGEGSNNQGDSGTHTEARQEHVYFAYPEYTNSH